MEFIESVFKAVLTTELENSLPDSAFAWVEDGGKKDDEGKTTPRSLRHLPYKNSRGESDLSHVRNALARLSQVRGLSAEKEKRIRAKLEKILVDSKDEKSASCICKSNKAKMIVYAAVLDPYGDGSEGCQADSQQDWMPPAEVEKACHKFMQSGRVIKKEHVGDPTGAVVVESWIEPYPSEADYIAAMENKDHSVVCRGFGDDVIHSGSWVMGVQLTPELWDEFEKGEIAAFSPHGRGMRKKATSVVFPKVTFIGADQ
jgi:hypothetical protein